MKLSNLTVNNRLLISGAIFIIIIILSLIVPKFSFGASVIIGLISGSVVFYFTRPKAIKKDQDKKSYSEERKESALNLAISKEKGRKERADWAKDFGKDLLKQK